jgi:hypothetical protein
MSKLNRALASFGILSFLLVASGWAPQQQQEQLKGSGVMKTETREVEPFTKIEIKIGASVDVTIGQQQSFEIEAEDNILPVITTTVKDGTLILDSSQPHTSTKSVKAKVVVPSFQGITISGAGNVNVKGLNEPKFAVSLRGAGQINVEGKAEVLAVDLAGAGAIDTRELAAKRAAVAVRGTGDIKVRADEALVASVSGRGNIRYTGDPKEVTRNISGQGSIKPL